MKHNIMEDSVGTRCAFTDLMKHGIVAIDRRVVPDPRNRFANLYRRCKRELLWIILIQMVCSAMEYFLRPTFNRLHDSLSLETHICPVWRSMGKESSACYENNDFPPLKKKRLMMSESQSS